MDEAVSVGVEVDVIQLLVSFDDLLLQNLVLTMSLLQFNFLLHEIFFENIIFVSCYSKNISFILEDFPESTGIVHISQRVQVLQEVALSLHHLE